MKEGNHLKKHLLALMAVILVAGMAQASTYRTWQAQVPSAPNSNQTVRIWINNDTVPGETAGVETLIGGNYTRYLGTYDATGYFGANWRVDIPAQAPGTTVQYQLFTRNEQIPYTDYGFTGFNWSYNVGGYTRTYTGPTTTYTSTTEVWRAMVVNRNPSSENYGYLYAIDTTAKKVKLFAPSSTGSWTTTAKTITLSSGNSPYDLAIGSDSTVWMLDNTAMKVESCADPTTGAPTPTGTVRITLQTNTTPSPGTAPRTIAVNGTTTTAKVYVGYVTAQYMQSYTITGGGTTSTADWTAAIGYNAYGITVDGTGAPCAPTPTTGLGVQIRRFNPTTGALADPSYLANKPAGSLSVTLPDLEFVNEPSYPGGGYFLASYRVNSAAPYKIVVFRYGSDGKYLDGWGTAQAGLPNYSTIEVTAFTNLASAAAGAWVTADISGNIIGRIAGTAAGGDFIRITPSSVAADYINPNLQTGDVVISQVYGGGGSTSSTYLNDYVELYNKSANPVNLAGWTLQYASNTGTTWSSNFTVLSGTIQPGAYFLVQEGAGGTGIALPTPDLVPSATNTTTATGLTMSATAGKVALVSSSAFSSTTTPSGTGLQDFVGYGTATTYEGSGPTPAPSVATSVIRNCNNVDTNNNSADFAVCDPPLPRNSSMGTPPLTITGQPTSQTVCSSDLPAVFTVTATGVPPISYQWYTGTPGSGTLLSGETGAYFATSTAGSYYVKVSTACESKDSNGVTLTIKSPATVGTPSASPVALSAGMSTTVTVDVTPGTDPVSSVTAVVNRTGAVTANLTNTGGNTWTGPVAIPTGAASGSATITVTAADGTCNNATNAVGVNVNAITAWVADATASPVHSSPVAVNGIVYYGDDLGRLWAYTISATPTAVAGLNPFDTRTKGAGSGAQILGRPLVRIEGGTPFVYVVTSNGYLFKVNATDGTQPWGAPALLLVTATTVSTTPAVFNTGDSSLPAQDFVFVGAGDGTNAYLYKVRASDGVLADTSISLGTDTKSSPAVGAGSVYIGVTGGADGVLRLNPVDLEILTNLAAGKTASGAPFISATTDIGRPYPVAYVSTDDGTIYAVNATTGALETTFGSGGSVALSITPATGLTPLSSNLFVYGNVLYVGANDNKVYAVNSTTGAVSTFFDAGGSQKAIKHGVAVDPGGSGNTGNLVFGSTDGCFYQIPLANPVAYSVFKVTDPAFYTVSTSPTIDLVGGYNLAGDDFSNVNIFPRF
jgi:hypothetical protein